MYTYAVKRKNKPRKKVKATTNRFHSPRFREQPVTAQNVPQGVQTLCKSPPPPPPPPPTPSPCSGNAPRERGEGGCGGRGELLGDYGQKKNKPHCHRSPRGADLSTFAHTIQRHIIEEEEPMMKGPPQLITMSVGIAEFCPHSA